MRVILDTETTGKEGRIIELAFLIEEDGAYTPYRDYCNPNEGIEIGAMAVHHITPDVIADKPPIQETGAYKKLQELNTPDNTLIIHNSKFDLEMLRKEGFENRMKLVDTLVVAKHAYPEMESYAMQFLYYYFELYKADDLNLTSSAAGDAHSAIGDVITLTKLYSMLREGRSDDDLVKLSAKTPIVHIMPFGKYKGQKIINIVKGDPRYLSWVLSKIEDLSDDLRMSINYWKKVAVNQIKGGIND